MDVDVHHAMPMAFAVSGLACRARLMGEMGSRLHTHLVKWGGKRMIGGGMGCGRVGITGMGAGVGVIGRGDELALGMGALGRGRREGWREVRIRGLERFGVRGRGERWLATQGKKDGEEKVEEKNNMCVDYFSRFPVSIRP